MPGQAQEYGGEHVETAPLPTMQLNPGGAPIEAFGGGASLERFNSQVQETAKIASSIAEKAWEHGNQLAVLDADNKQNDLATQTIYGPNGLLSKQGKDAAAAFQPAMDEFDKGTQKILEGLSNKAQQMSFLGLAKQRRYQAERIGQRHVEEQLRAYDETETSSFIKNSQSQAINSWQDSDLVETELGRQQAALIDFSRRQNKGPEWLKEQILDSSSKTQSGVIRQMLAAGRDQDAQAYFDKVKDDIKGPDQEILAGALKEGSTRGESQRLADGITDKAEDRAEALQMVRDQVSDPKVRDMTTERVMQFYNEQNEAKREAQNNIYQKAALLVDQHPNTPVRQLIDPSSWTNMTAEQRQALQNRFENPANDDKKWLDFADLQPTQMAALSRADFETKYWANFDRAHRDRAVALWEEAQNSKRQSAALASTLSFNQRVDSAFRTSGLVPANIKKSDFNADQASMYAQFEQSAAREIEQFELTNLGGKRKATGDEMQKIIDGMMTKKVFIDKAWARDPEKPAAALTADEMNRAYVPIDKIKTADRNVIENLIRSNSRRVSTDKVQRAYAAYLTGDRDRFMSIVRE